MSVIARIMMAFFGYVLACIAASLVLTLGSLAPNWNDVMAPLGPNAGAAESIALWSVTGLAAIIIFSVGFLPTLLVIALAEVWRCARPSSTALPAHCWRSPWPMASILPAISLRPRVIPPAIVKFLPRRELPAGSSIGSLPAAARGRGNESVEVRS